MRVLILFRTTIVAVTMACCLATAAVFTPGAQPRLLASSFYFTEGPAADRAGNVFFSDMISNDVLTVIYAWRTNQSLAFFATNWGAANGLYFDSNDVLYACEGKARRLARIDSNGVSTAVVSSYAGKPFNRPNDLWIDPRGGIYFTDPTWATPTQDGRHVYYAPPGSNGVVRVITNMYRPNGLIGTPDRTRLYVADVDRYTTYVYTITQDGTLSNQRLFATVSCDGMTLDDAGNVYLTDIRTSRQHVVVYDEDGRYLDSVRMAYEPSNVTRGGPLRDTLFITANKGTNPKRGYLYTMPLQVGAFRHGMPGQSHGAGMIAQGYPDRNFGGLDSMAVGYDAATAGTMRACLAFTLTNLYLVTNVTLKVRTHATNTGVLTQLAVHRLLRTPVQGTGTWSAAAPGATWLQAGPGDAWTTPGGDYEPVPLSVSTGVFRNGGMPIYFTATTNFISAARAAACGGPPLALVLLASSPGSNNLVLANVNAADAFYRPILYVDDIPVSNRVPRNGAVGMDLTLTLASSLAYIAAPNPPLPSQSEWQLAADADFTQIVWQRVTNVFTLAVPTNTLGNGVRYYWRMRYGYDGSHWSTWTDGTWFQTAEATFIPPDGPTNPVGVAHGIFPGRVSWVHHPLAPGWDGLTTSFWWEAQWTAQASVDTMLSKAVRDITGATSDAQAWQMLFTHFNTTHGRGEHGYLNGEQIAIKANYVGCGSWYDSNKTNNYALGHNIIMTSPHMTLALLRQLVNHANVPQSNIVVYESNCLVGDCAYRYCTGDFAQVRFVDYLGLLGRDKAVQDTNNPIHLSNGAVTFYPPRQVTATDYMINLAALKSHEAATGGNSNSDKDTRAEFVSLCAKNHFGSFCGSAMAAHPYIEATNHYGTYHVLVDLMGHRHLGGKTMLFLIDGLYGGLGHWDAMPERWWSEPFNGNWPASLLASQDGCAIDSVGLDLLRTERLQKMVPLSGSVDLFLHEAATADNPASGTFYDPEGDGTRLASLGVHEHWLSADQRLYSRNLDSNVVNGIELIYAQIPEPATIGALLALLAVRRRVLQRSRHHHGAKLR